MYIYPKSLKDHLVSAKNKCESSLDNKSAPCLDAKFVHLLKKIENNTFQSKDKSEIFDI